VKLALVVMLAGACTQAAPRPVFYGPPDPRDAKIVTSLPPMDPDPDERAAWMTTPVATARTPVVLVKRASNNRTIVRFVPPDPRMDATWEAFLIGQGRRSRCWIRRVGRREAECDSATWPIYAVRSELEISPPAVAAVPASDPPASTRLRMRHPPVVRARVVFVEPSDDRVVLHLLVGSVDGVDRKHTCLLLVPSGSGSERALGSSCSMVRIDRMSTLVVVRDVAARVENAVVELTLP